MPKRLQRTSRGLSKLPPGAIFVGYSSPWAPIYPIGEFGHSSVVQLTRNHVESMSEEELARYLAPLRGKDLVCDCKLDSVCHADFLLTMANR